MNPHGIPLPRKNGKFTKRKAQSPGLGLICRVVKWACIGFVMLMICFRNLECYGQPNSYKFTHIGMRDGLSHPLVMSICEDRNGFMWMGTKQGMNRYNGIQVRNYKYSAGIVHSLKDIFHIQEDQFGTLWAIAGGKMIRYNQQTDSFYQVLSLQSQYIANSFFIDRKNRLWCCWKDTIRAYQLSAKGIVRQIIGIPAAMEDVRGYDEDKAGNLWCITEKQGIFRIHPESGQVRNLVLTAGTSQAMSLRSIKVLSNQWICAGGYIGGLVFLDTAMNILHHEYFGTQGEVALRSTGVRGIHEFGQFQGKPQLLLGTSNEGVVLYRLADHSYRHVNSKEWSEACHDQFIRTLSSDRAGNIWVGTMSEGAYVLFRKQQHFKSYYLGERISGGLQNKVHYVKKDIDFPKVPVIWCSSMNHGINGFNLSTGQWIPLVSSANLTNTFAFYQLNRDEFLTGNISETYYLLNKINRKGGIQKVSIRHLLQKDTSFRGENFGTFVYDICMPEPGVIYVSDQLRGLFTYRLSDQKVNWLYAPMNQGYGLPVKRSDGICEADSQGIYVASHDVGVYRIDKKTRIIREVKPLMHRKPMSIPGIQALCTSPDKRFLYMGSIDGDGVYKYDTYHDTCLQINEKDGLSNDHCINLACDDQGRIWIGTEYGLNCYNPSTGKIVSFSDRVSWKSPTMNCNMLYDQGNIITGGDACILMANTDTILGQSATKLTLMIDRLSTQHRMLARCISGNNQGPELSHHENSLQVSFNLTNLFESGSAAYQFKLSGADTVWKNLGSQNSLTLSNLSPGSYCLYLRAIQYGTDNYSEASYSFIILKPWYRTNAFFLLIGFIISLLVFFIYRWRIQGVYKEAALHQKLSELRMSSLRSQMNPHFIFNSLNSIQRFILQRDSLQASNYLNQFAQLMRSILDNSHASEVSLQSEIDLLHHYIQLEQLRFEDKFTYTISVEDTINPIELTIPGMIIQPFIENAIWHGLMNKESTGQLQIRFRLLQDVLECQIEDDGIGRKASAEIKANQVKTYVSRGMQITRERMEALNRGEVQNTEYEMIDLYTEDGHPKGTLAIIRFQVKPKPM